MFCLILSRIMYVLSDNNLSKVAKFLEVSFEFSMLIYIDILCMWLVVIRQFVT